MCGESEGEGWGEMGLVGGGLVGGGWADAGGGEGFEKDAKAS